MKAVIALSGLAGLALFGPPTFHIAARHHDISILVREAEHQRVSWQDQGQCRYESERSLIIPVSKGSDLRVIAGAGSLEVVGVEGLKEVRASGRACASHADALDQIQLSSETSGSTLTLETHHPDWSAWRDLGEHYARLDLKLEVPAGISAEIKDGSGEVVVAAIGSLVLQDGSGEVELHDIRGDLKVDDGSGELTIRGVQGMVWIEDGSGEVTLEDVGGDVQVDDSSGELQIRRVGGSLTISDSSGEIDVEGVEGTVRVSRDSSGSIHVDGVGGDFVVERDGGGSISFENVVGRVEVPRKKSRS